MLGTCGAHPRGGLDCTHVGGVGVHDARGTWVFVLLPDSLAWEAVGECCGVLPWWLPAAPVPQLHAGMITHTPSRSRFPASCGLLAQTRHACKLHEQQDTRAQTDTQLQLQLQLIQALRQAYAQEGTQGLMHTIGCRRGTRSTDTWLQALHACTRASAYTNPPVVWWWRGEGDRVCCWISLSKYHSCELMRVLMPSSCAHQSYSHVVRVSACVCVCAHMCV